MEIPDYITYGAWLRLDPTPAGEGSNAGGSLRSRMGQFETLQQLWEDYVMGVSSSDQPAMLELFNAKDQGLVGAIRLNIEKMILSLQTNQLVGGVFTPTKWFSMQGALGIVVFISLLIGAYRLGFYVIRKLFKLRRDRRSIDPQRLTHIKFYRRVVQALAKLHLKRAPNQTPLEFAKQVEEHFRSKKDVYGEVEPQIQFLTSIYYRLRFGFEPAIKEAEWQEIEKATQSLEQLSSRKVQLARAST